MRRIASEPWSGRQSTAPVSFNDSAFYEFNAGEVELLEAATNELAKMSLAAARHIIDNRLYSRMGIPASAVPLIESSWNAEPPSLCGRLDLFYDGVHPPKLLEYNADTPTSLPEAAMVQRCWLEDRFPGRDQFNSIHRRLVERWSELAPQIPGGHVDFCPVDDVGDGVTARYLEETAQQAGLITSTFPIAEIGWDGRSFIGPDGRELAVVFKLYPWEWMVREEFGKHLPVAPTLWMEPAWKMLLSNKGLLSVLWELYPRHPYLLEARFDSPGLMMSWVKKPLLGREGSNIALHQPGKDFETSGDCGAEGFIYQALAPIENLEGVYPVVDSWVVGHQEGQAAAGIGVRESATPISTRLSQFVPHVIG